jgi:hypothetical protein
MQVFIGVLGLDQGSTLYFLRSMNTEEIKKNYSLELRSLVHRPAWQVLPRWQLLALAKSSGFAGFFKPRFLLWNTGIPLLLFLAVLFFLPKVAAGSVRIIFYFDSSLLPVFYPAHHLLALSVFCIFVWIFDFATGLRRMALEFGGDG